MEKIYKKQNKKNDAFCCLKKNNKQKINVPSNINVLFIKPSVFAHVFQHVWMRFDDCVLCKSSFTESLHRGIENTETKTDVENAKIIASFMVCQQPLLFEC